MCVLPVMTYVTRLLDAKMPLKIQLTQIISDWSILGTLNVEYVGEKFGGGYSGMNRLK